MQAKSSSAVKNSKGNFTRKWILYYEYVDVSIVYKCFKYISI